MSGWRRLGRVNPIGKKVAYVLGQHTSFMRVYEDKNFSSFIRVSSVAHLRLSDVMASTRDALVNSFHKGYCSYRNSLSVPIYKTICDALDFSSFVIGRTSFDLRIRHGMAFHYCDWEKIMKPYASLVEEFRLDERAARTDPRFNRWVSLSKPPKMDASTVMRLLFENRMLRPPVAHETGTAIEWITRGASLKFVNGVFQGAEY